MDLWAEWCGPCKTLGPIIEKVVDETRGAVELAKVDVDANPQIAQAFQVQSIPAVFAIHDGQIVDTFVGALPEAQVREFVERLAPGASARGPAGRTRATRRRCARRWRSTRRNVEAAVALGDFLRQEDRLDEAEALLDAVRARPRRKDRARADPPAANRRASRRGPRPHARTPARAVRPLTRTPRPNCSKYSTRSARGSALRHLPSSPRESPLLVHVFRPAGPLVLALGARRVDLTHRALVMGILNRTRDSFFEPAATFDLDALLRARRAARRGRCGPARRRRREGGARARRSARTRSSTAWCR